MWKHSDSASDENAQAEVNNNLLMAKPGRLFTPQLPDLSVVLNYLNTHSLHCSQECMTTDSLFQHFLIPVCAFQSLV